MRKLKLSMLSVLICFIVIFCSATTTVFASDKNPAKPKNLQTAVGNKTVTLKWDSVTNATGYQIFQYNSEKNSFKKIGYTKKNNFKITKLTNDISYQFKVRSYKRVNKKNYYSKFTEPVYATPTVIVNRPKEIMSIGIRQKVRLTWSKVNLATGYKIYQYDNSKKKYVAITTKKTNSYVVSNLKKGNSYQFRVRAYRKVDGKTYFSKFSAKTSVTLSTAGVSTIKTFLKTALQPVGSTMYIWGGGWNEADTGAGEDATRIGVSPQWRKFFNKQTSSYDYNNTRYQLGNGLDCSGYVGWTVYNILNTTSGKKGYVMKSREFTSNFSSRGWGTYVSRSKVRNYKAGDIMSSACSCCGHVWIVLGSCSDGSVVLVHSSPSGVQINGTVTPSGSYKSEAIKLANKYMKKYYPKWYKKYPNCSRGLSYLSHYSQMHWDTSGKSIMTDPDHYTTMSASKILKDLFKN